MKVSKYHSKVAPAYSYLLNSRCNDFTFGAEFGVPNISTGLVAHADDIPCIFKNDGVFLGPPSEEQAKTIKAMVHEWTTFAKSLKVFFIRLSGLVYKNTADLLQSMEGMGVPNKSTDVIPNKRIATYKTLI